MTDNNSVLKQAACVLLPHPHIKGMYLGVSRRDNAANFGLPGGKTEPGETPEQAAIRETFEETGLTVSGLTPVFSQKCHNPTTGIDYFVTTFTADKMEGEIRSSEEGRVMWVVEELLVSGPFGAYNQGLFEVMKTRVSG